MKGGAGGSSDSSIYHLFVEQAKGLGPKYLSMVVPSRWLAGGRGLDEFRKEMLSSHKLLRLVDFPVSREVFPNVEVKGGICYFLWSDTHNGECNVTVVRGDGETSALRQLDEFDVFVRDPMAVSILRKVLKAGEKPITEILTADTPFGIATNFEGFHDKMKSGDIALYYVRSGKRGVGFVPRSKITKNATLIDKWKVLVPKAGSDGGQKIPDSVLGKPWLSPPHLPPPRPSSLFVWAMKPKPGAWSPTIAPSFSGISFRCANSHKTPFAPCIHGPLSSYGIASGRMKRCTKNTSSQPRR
jgi:site-specific DNA-methyltransferase (adenine-specific)